MGANEPEGSYAALACDQRARNVRPNRKIVKLGSQEFALAVWVGAVRAMVVALGESIGLPHPILEGRYNGTVLGFTR
jgi:hypothetical protein